MLRTFHFHSELPVSAELFWKSQSLATVNAELRPMYRMSAPSKWLALPFHEWKTQQYQLKSWVLFCGLIPVDRHHFGTMEFPEPTTFVETSSSWLNRLWRHERTVQQSTMGCEVKDKVSFEPRLSFLAPFQKALYILVFRQRHKNLRRLHGRTAG
jgi:ligand-binding SRPBCC domain-containing protein